MTKYTATIAHHSIRSARVINFTAKTLAAAKARATREFGCEQQNYIIQLSVDDLHPVAYWSKRVGDNRRNAWLAWEA